MMNISSVETNETKEAAVKLLNELLADEILLKAKTQNYCWNLRGRSRKDLQRIYRDQQHVLDRIIEELIESIQELGGVCGSLAEVLAAARLVDHSGQSMSAAEAMLDLACDHRSMIRNISEDRLSLESGLGGNEASDMIRHSLEQHHKMGSDLYVLLNSIGLVGRD